MRSASVAVVVALLLTSCSLTSSPRAQPAPTVTDRRATPSTPASFPGGGRFDYQIGGPYDPDASVAVVGRDRREEPAPGRYNVCYVNAFQTQPDEADLWSGLDVDLLVRRDDRLVTDPDWPGEHLLDTSTPAKRTALAAVVGVWIDGCAASGFDGVEPDNLDSWTRSQGVLTREDNTAFATLLAERAHSRGLTIGQKNTSELGTTGRDEIGFDFAVVEECQVHDECDTYTDVYGDRVVEVEYTDNPRSAYTEACRARGAAISVTLRDRDVVPRGRPGFVDESC